ncbi:MAG: hypothetical protein V8Q21_03905 [Akkermansia muciniphila]
MIDSIDNNMAAPSGEADFSGAVSPEAEVLTEAAAQTAPLPSLLGEDGGFVPDWYARFDELRGMEKSLSKFKTPEALAKSYAELERLRHYPGVENEEQMARFRRMAGLPESEEDYRLERPESMPESEWNAGLAERMARTAYRYGVPPEAMNALQETMARAYEEAREQVADSRMEMETQAEQSLQQEWGASYERNMGRATAALQRLASETGVDADALLDNPGLGSNPDVIRLLYQVSRLLDEAPLHHSGAAAPSPAEEAMRMESDPSHPLYEAYMNVNHPNHRYANELYDRLTSR